jgi:aminopeptidase N
LRRSLPTGRQAFIFLFFIQQLRSTVSVEYINPLFINFEATLSPISISSYQTYLVMKSRRKLFLLTILFQTHSSFSQSNIDVLHYKFEIELSDMSDTIKGRAFITLQFSETANKFWLNLTSPNGKGKGMIAYPVKENSEPVTSVHGNDSLIIMLKKPVQKGEIRTFEIMYQGIPSDGLIISKNRYGDRTFFADNWPNRAHNWIPCKDELTDKATFEFIVTAPSQYQVISNGKLEEEKGLPDRKKLTHWIEDVSLPTKVMVIGVAKFAIKQFADSPPNIPVSAWVYPQDSVTGFRNYSFAPAIVKFYSDYIAAYPYNKLANVQSKTRFGAMENATAIFYNEESAEERQSIEDLLAHEIAHQWFGDMSTEKSFPHLWLSEGFATYLADIYIESKYGTDAMNKRLKEERKKVINFAKFSGRPVVDSVSSSMILLSPNSYERGAWVLHMLRKQIGDSVFHTIIRRYYDDYKGKNADTEDFRNIAEEVTGKNLKQFFKQWLYIPEIPQLNIQWNYNKITEELLVTVSQFQKEVFQFPLQFDIESEVQKAKTVTVQIDKKTETFKFKVQKKLLRFVIDPNVSLLFEEIKR